MGQEKKALGGSLAAAQGIPHAGVILNSEVGEQALQGRVTREKTIQSASLPPFSLPPSIYTHTHTLSL